MNDLTTIYRIRFETTGLQKRRRIWRVLCSHYFSQLIGPNKDILDLACGHGEFINNISGRSREAIDLNSDATRYLDPDIKFTKCPAHNLSSIESASKDVVFTSNFLEHLPSKATCDLVFDEVKRLLRPNGRFIIVGPNIRYAYKKYWDYYDHQLPLSHLSLEEGLLQKGFVVILNISRFLPYTMKSRFPSSDYLIKAYLRLPLAWKLLGKQFLIVAQKR
jgi:SAM-dependent methyltransferase